MMTLDDQLTTRKRLLIIFIFVLPTYITGMNHTNSVLRDAIIISLSTIALLILTEAMKQSEDNEEEEGYSTFAANTE